MPAAKIEIGRRYTGAQIRQLIGQAEAKELELQGMVLQFDTISQTYAVVPWHQASQPFRQDGNRAQRRAVQRTVGKEAFGELDPIVKRTATQRVDSLMAKWLIEMKKAGGLPGLVGDVPEGASVQEREAIEQRAAHERKVMDEKIKEIVGAAWVEGRTEITADVVRMVASHFLNEAEAKAT